MGEGQGSSLRDRIKQEMVTEGGGILERCFDRAQRLLTLTTEGNVEIPEKARLTAKEQLLAYMLGKLYAQEGECCESAAVANLEFREQLGMPEGTLLPALKELRDSHMIDQTKEGRTVRHSIRTSRVERVLRDLERKLGAQEGSKQ